MFTRVSEKFRLVAGTLLTAGALFVVVSACFIGVARWTERSAHSYPWRGEDYLRYLMPTLFGGDGRERILIAGPSEAREDLLYEAFEEAFPEHRAVQGGLSLGVFDDLLLGLEYWEQSFGSAAVPRTIVMGVTTRWVANIPRARSPLYRTIDRYSLAYRVLPSATGPVLEEKTLPQRAVAWLRFLDKQPMRYKAAVCTMLQQVVGGGSVAERVRAGKAVERGAVARFRAALEECRSPYKYHHLPPMAPATIESWMSDPGSFWYKTHKWQPAADSAMIAARFARLRAMTDRLGIDVFVVNLPEHPSNRARFDALAYAQYEQLLQQATRGWPMLDLRGLLTASDFYDAGHATVAGAIRTTDETIRFMRHQIATRTRSQTTLRADAEKTTHNAGGT